MPKGFLEEKRSQIIISLGIGIFSSAVVALIARAFSVENSWLISSLPIAFFSSLVSGVLWGDWKPGVIFWTLGQVLFWGSIAIVMSYLFTLATLSGGEWGGISMVADMLCFVPVGCIFGIFLGLFSYSKILVWDSKMNSNLTAGWTVGVLIGFIINLLLVFVAKELTIFGAIIGALCGLLTGLVMSKFSPTELQSNHTKNA
jgi:hypothetical protein